MNRKAFGESILYWVDFTDSFFNPKKFCQTDWTLWTPRIILSKVMLKWGQLSCLRGDTVLSAVAYTSERLLLHIFCSLFWQDLGAKNLMMWLNATMFVLCWLCANFQKYAIYFSRCLKCRHSAKNLVAFSGIKTIQLNLREPSNIWPYYFWDTRLELTFA